MPTDEQLRAIMPNLPAPRRGELLPFLQAAITEFAIEAPAREAAFLAQLAHESGQFRFMEEIWGPTDAQRRYEPRSSLATTLGNTEPGDGKRFKGRGPIQITGRANYRRFGDLLGIDIVSDPPRAALPDLAFRLAGLFWTKNGLNELADRATAEAFRQITRRINGGLNGIADRERFYAVACKVLGVRVGAVERGAERGIEAAAPGEPVFERGYEAVRTLTRRRRARKGATVARKRKSATRKGTTPARKRSPGARKGGTAARKGATSARKSTTAARKGATAPRKVKTQAKPKARMRSTSTAGKTKTASRRRQKR